MRRPDVFAFGRGRSNLWGLCFQDRGEGGLDLVALHVRITAKQDECLRGFRAVLRNCQHFDRWQLLLLEFFQNGDLVVVIFFSLRRRESVRLRV